LIKEEFITKDTKEEKITKEEGRGIRGFCTKTIFELHDKIADNNL